MNTVKELAKPAQTPTNGSKLPTQIQTAVTPEPSKIKGAKEEETILPLEDRLHKLNMLFDLQKKFNRLAETKAKLQSFEIAQNRENSELLISDDEGNEFKTTNPEVIEEVKKLVLKVISQKESEVAAKLNW
ncbi:MAG: hypothetical protein H7320_11640 [Ferruginibacter sp.]|nr:hypothetical protein [Ferruginibacter sp.]